MFLKNAKDQEHLDCYNLLILDEQKDQERCLFFDESVLVQMHKMLLFMFSRPLDLAKQVLSNMKENPVRHVDHSVPPLHGNMQWWKHAAPPIGHDLQNLEDCICCFSEIASHELPSHLEACERRGHVPMTLDVPSSQVNKKQCFFIAAFVTMSFPIFHW